MHKSVFVRLLTSKFSISKLELLESATEERLRCIPAFSEKARSQVDVENIRSDNHEMALAEKFLTFTEELQCWALARFRVVVPALLGVSYSSVILIHLIDWPEWLLLLFGFPPYLFATIVTYRRLRVTGRSGWWIWLMIIYFGLGPEWHGLRLGALINLVPVVLVWRTPEHSDPGLETA